MANLQKRNAMNFYPQMTSKGSEAWHFSKWVHDAPDSVLTPMIKHRERHFYVEELVQCYDGEYFLPQRWVRDENGRMGAFGRHVIKLGVCCSVYLRPCTYDAALC